MWARDLALATVFTSLFAVASGQTAESSKRSPASVRPDISGIWVPDVYFGPAPNAAKAEFTPEYQAKYEANHALYAAAEKGAAVTHPDSIMVRRMGRECLPYGMPRLMRVQDSLDIVQASNRILIVGENGEDRRIWLDRPQRSLEELNQLGYFGRSVGKWEGPVLVVNTIGIEEPLEGEDLMPHSDQMVITERLYLKKGLLIDDVTITDPLALKKPWKLTYKRRRAPADYEPTEWVCENAPHYGVDKNGNNTVR